MIYSNLFIVCVIFVVVILPNDINGQQQLRPGQQPPQQLLQQPQFRPQQQPQQRPPQRRPQQLRPQQTPQLQQPQQPRPQPQQPRPQQPRPQQTQPQQPRPQQTQPQPQQPQQQPQQGQCSPRGGSCQQNNDCCSTSCLQQRCQRSVQEIQQEIAQGYSGSNVPFWHVPGGRQYNNIDNLLGSIYEDGQSSGNNRPGTTGSRPAINNNRPVAVTNPNTFRQLNSNLPVSNSLGSRFGDNDDSSSTQQQTSGQCFAIGAKCTRGLECCTTRCHGFLHKCVM